MENPWGVRVRVGGEDILDSKSPNGIIQHHNNDKTHYTIQNPHGYFYSMGIEFPVDNGNFQKAVGATNGTLTLGSRIYTIEIDIESSDRVILRTRSQSGMPCSINTDIQTDIITNLQKSMKTIINFLDEKDGVNSRVLKVVRGD